MAEAFTGMVDILFGYDTDIHFENGDLMVTTGIDYIEREVYKLLITEPGEWKADPRIGCTPNEFIGENNTRELGSIIQTHIEDGLKFTVMPAQVSVRVVPTDYEHLIIFIDIFVQGAEITSVPFQFDFVKGFKKLDKIDSRVTKPRSSQEYKINDISTVSNPNKYWDNLRKDSVPTDLFG